ncbi:MAG: amino acid adenylation domain-containing protein, partial [Burkholderiales bacterium]|nr:amino acid adenylation domain-containing protein [Burkholderiales bacterium]
DCGARLLLCREDFRLAGVDIPHVAIERLDLRGAQATCPPVATHPLQAAYVMYTSGSTGQPKGVVVPHQAVAHFALNGAHVTLQPSDRVAFLANVAFDASTFEVWATLLNGASSVVIEQAVLLDPPALARRMLDQQVSIAHLTAGLLPGYWRALAEVLPQLRCLLTGGDRADVAAVADILEQAAPQCLLHCYGPTETTTFAATYRVQALERGAQSIALGRPLDNTRIHILDAWGQPCPIGVAGELHIAGAGLARGYLNRPELTAERFVPDPFGAPGSRMYRSGDLARWRVDGTLDFLGRNDHQVKIRGFRIELGEIEAALQACPGVREAVVLARQDGEHKRLVAYLVGEESVSPDALTPESLSSEALRTQLSTRLPEYMLPAAYVRLPALPLTPNGKLDRQALPEPDASALGSRAYEPPQGAIEETLAALWCELLGLAQVGRHDDFFALGGHSLLAVRLIERMRELGWALEVRALFATPVLAALAASVVAARAVAVPPNTIPAGCGRITPELLPLLELTQPEIDAAVVCVPGGAAQVQDIYPLAPLQHGLLFHHLASAQGDVYLT